MTEENKPQESEQPKLSKAEQLKQENDLFERELSRKEELNAREKLGGGTAGNIPQEKPKEETPKEYSKRIMGGNGKYGEQ